MSTASKILSMNRAHAKTDTQDASFSELYQQYLNSIYTYIYSRVQNTADAEDLCSQTFMTALETRHRLRDPNSFKPWLFTIARDKVNDHFRLIYRRPKTELSDSMIDRLSLREHEGVMSQDRMIELEQLLLSLKPNELEYICLRLIAELPFSEMAQVLKQSENKVKKTYYKLLARLKAQVE